MCMWYAYLYENHQIDGLVDSKINLYIFAPFVKLFLQW